MLVTQSTLEMMNLTALSYTLSKQQRLKKLAENRRGKDFFVGHIHGHYTHLQQALKKADFNPHTDRLFCTGNLIDYGQENEHVLALLEQPWFHSVIGIHELLLRVSVETGNVLHWHTRGGEWAFTDDMQLKSHIPALLERINTLPLAIEVAHKSLGNIGVLSAGPSSAESWSQCEQLSAQDALDTLLDESLPERKQALIREVDYLVVGNLMARAPWCRSNIVGINLGARLLPERGKLALVKAKKLAKVCARKERFKPIG